MDKILSCGALVLACGDDFKQLAAKPALPENSTFGHSVTICIMKKPRALARLVSGRINNH
ncbi:hypothetical protein ACI77I_26430 [Pseudomonas sp. D47]|uniref:hypothetical protein n=1 Tax=Pseudomonas sp. D47 TaxID=3159447 RepID=UPI00387B861B